MPAQRPFWTRQRVLELSLAALVLLGMARYLTARRRPPPPAGLRLTPSTEEHLAGLPPEDYTQPIAKQRELREASAEALRLRDGQLPMHSVRTLAPEGARPALRVFVPPGASEGSAGGSGAPPYMLYAHGGGWVLGSLNTHDELCRRLARAAGTVVVSVEYRLAPEHVFPAALEDMAAAYAWAAREAAGRGVVVAGDSAGGNLAAGLALRLRDEAAAPQPAALLLIYPALDSTCSAPSYETFNAGYGLSRAGMRYFWGAYLGGEDGLASAPVHASPLQAASLAGLPPMLVAVAEADVLHDEGVAWAQRVGEEGGLAELVTARGQVHGFIKRPGNPDAGEFVDRVTARIMEIAALQGQ